MLTNLDARNAISEAINAGDAHHTQYDLDAIVAGVHEATGGYDIEAMDTAAFWKLIEDNALPVVNLVVLDHETTAPGIEYGLAVGTAPAIDNTDVRAFLDGLDEDDTDTYVLAVPEELWTSELNGLPRFETGVPAEQVKALVDAINAE
ncbi:hypothetical protein [Nocardia asiatica]|uniref:hypothetical protein n=1 Tax=Nocardia asiatica TaxID=209252 RepID=UPI002457350A|nr:hypothetical protein [Nocardia asiatica]